ncbi:MAG TPA: hypothetical protein VFQ61_27520 [Polyangiaceae bacterium]|nr:hypothetical protein [Polyangiaceae bacterium]
MPTLPNPANPDPTAEQADSEDGDGPDEELPGLLDPMPAWDTREEDADSGNDFLDWDLERGLERPSQDDEEEGVDIGSETQDLSPLPNEGSADEPVSDYSRRRDEEELGVGEVGTDWLTEDSGQSALDDEAEGLEEIDLEQPELPNLQPEDESELPVHGELPLATAFADEARPRPASPPWALLEPPLELESCAAIATTDGVVVAASSDLLWFSPGELGPLRLEAGSTPVHSVALLGTNWDLAICATESGKLLRRGRLSSASEVLRGAREAGDSAARQTLDLCQPGTGFPHALLVRTANGRLFRSDDDGATLRPLNTPKVVAVAPRAAVALSPGLLLQSYDAGGSFEERALSGLARELSLAPAPLLAVCKNVIALAEPSLGVVISQDSGRTFQRIPGSTNANALAVGEQDGELCVFAALYDGARDRSTLIRIYGIPRSAEEIARIEASEPGGASEDAEEGRVAQLVWDATQQRLWAVGGFGVRIYEPRRTQ